MGQVQNGHLYIMYKSSSQKTKQRSSKRLQTNAKSTLKIPLTFNKVEKTKLEDFNFVHLFSSSFFFARHNPKSIQCIQILNIPNNWSANLLHTYLFWSLCELRVASYGLKTVPKSFRILMHTLLGFSRNNCVGVARIVRPHLDYWMRVVQAATSLLGTNCV